MVTSRVDGVKRDAEVAPDVPAQRPELAPLQDVAVEEAQRAQYPLESITFGTRIKVLGFHQILVAP